MTLFPLQRGLAHFDDEPFPQRRLRAERRELAAELLLGGSPFGLLQGLQANDDRLGAVAHPAVTMADRVEQVHHLVVVLVIRTQPVDHLLAGIPYPGGHEVEQVFPFVVHLFERAVVLQGGDVYALG